MHKARQFVACIALVVIDYLLVAYANLLSPWVYLVPSAAATVVAVLISRVSLPFVFVTLAIVGPILTFAVLFLMSGNMYAGQAAEHLRAAMSPSELLGICAPPFVGSAIWFVLRYLTIRSSGPL